MEAPVEVSQLKFFPKLSNTCLGNYLRRLIVSLKHNVHSPYSLLPLFHQPLLKKKKKIS